MDDRKEIEDNILFPELAIFKINDYFLKIKMSISPSIYIAIIWIFSLLN